MLRTVTSKSDGITLGIEVDGIGQPCVLVHGTTADKSRWRQLVERHSAKYTFFAYDRRGRGDSDDHSEYSLEKEIGDLESVLESLAEPAMLLGHSSGAIISLEACVRVSDRVRKLVLYEPPIPTGSPLYDKGILEKLDEKIEANRASEALELFFSDVVKMPDSDLEDMKNSQIWAKRVIQAHTIPREMMASDQYNFDRGKFDHLGVPTLLLKGGDSPEKFTKPVDLLGEALPKSKVVSMAGQQHVAMNTNPELFENLVLSFFALEP